MKPNVLIILICSLFTLQPSKAINSLGSADYLAWAGLHSVVGTTDDDDDRDGLNNFQEYAFGLDPQDPASMQCVLGGPDLTTGNFCYTRRPPTLSGLAYTIWTSTDLTTWQMNPDALQTAAAGETADVETVSSSVMLQPMPSQLFVRVSATYGPPAAPPVSVSEAGELDFIHTLEITRIQATLPSYKVYPAAAAMGLGPMHPSVARFEEPWNGYRYWMAYTPYGSGGAGQENPCIAVSQDGEVWIDPPGLVNPLVPRPAPPDSYKGRPFNANDYNSDPNLFYLDGLLYLSWRHRLTAGGDAYLWYKTSADGITWSPRAMMMDNTARNGASGHDVIAQSVLPLPGGGFELWGTDSSTTPYGFNRFTAPTIQGPWTWQGSAVFTGFPANASIWHSSVHKIGKKWVVLFNVTSLKGTSEGPSYFAESTDGIHFTLSDKPLAYISSANPTGGFSTYKSDFMLDQVDGKTVLRLWLGSASNFNNAIAEFSSESSLARYLRVMPDASSLKNNYVFGDMFTRANASTAGISSSGTAWSAATGSFSIDANRVRASASGNNKILANSGAADCRIAMRISVSDSTQTYLLFRRKASNDSFFRFGYAPGSNRAVLQKIDSGVVTTITMAYGYPMLAGDWFSVELRGPEIKLFYNNTRFATVYDPMNQTETQHGIQSTSPGTFIDSFFVESLTPP